jgi:hypothetical protein
MRKRGEGTRMEGLYGNGSGKIGTNGGSWDHWGQGLGYLADGTTKSIPTCIQNSSKFGIRG